MENADIQKFRSARHRMHFNSLNPATFIDGCFIPLVPLYLVVSDNNKKNNMIDNPVAKWYRLIKLLSFKNIIRSNIFRMNFETTFGSGNDNKNKNTSGIGNKK